MSQENNPHQLSINFMAKEHDAKALHEALLLVLNAWSKHQRISEVSCELTNPSPKNLNKNL
jgi:hypothetical protein